MKVMATKKNPLNTPLHVGDTVSLKSGGPTMTINSLVDGQPRAAKCIWFYRGVPQEQTFALETLKRRTTGGRKRPSVPYRGY